MTRANSALARFLPPIVIFAAVFAAFWPALSADFVTWDDDVNFLVNDSWRGLGHDNLDWMLTTFHMGPYQPLSWMSLGLDYEVWGLDGPRFHLTNVVLHALTAVAFWYTARRFFLAVRGSDCWFAALVAALVFALHPLRVESVAWITERRDVLSGLFFVLAIGMWLRYASGGKPLTYWLACGLVLLSLLSKAAAVVMPALLFVLDVWPLKRTHLGWRRLFVEKLPFVAMAVIFGWLAVHGQSEQGHTLVDLERHGFAQRAAQVAFGLVFYVWRTIVPRNLIPIHELPDPFDPTVARFVVPVVVVVIAAVVLFALRRRAPALVATALAYAVILSPVSGILQAGPQLVADRYSYVACMPFALLAGCAVAWAIAQWPDARALVVGVVLVIVGGLGALTFRQSGWWHDSETLWRRTLAINPKSPTAHVNLGAVFLQRGDDALDPLQRDRSWNEAQMQWETGLAVRPDPQMHVNLGLLTLRRLQIDPSRREELATAALAHVDRGLALGRDQLQYKPAWQIARASALMAAGRCPEAVAAVEPMARTAPTTQALPRTLATAYACAGRPAEAFAAFAEALKIEPADSVLWFRAGEVAAQIGRIDDARAAFRHVLDLRAERVGARASADPEWKQARAALDRLQ